MDQEEAQEFLAPDNGGWHYTVMRDWIAVCPELSATAARLYWIVRSIMHEKGDRKRRLSVDQLCWLLPGINGKPSSETRVKTALRELESVELLSNPDGDVVRRWITDPKTGKQTRENYRRWQVHDFPKQGYQGPKSALALLDEYPGPGWREATQQTSEPTEGRKSAPQSQSKRSPAKTKKSAGRTEGRKSASSGRKSASSGRKSGDFNAVTSTEKGPKEVLQGSSLSNPSSSGSSPAPEAVEAQVHEEEEGHNHTKSTQTENRFRAEAEILLDEVRFKPGRYLRRQARRQVVELIALRLSDGHTVQALRDHLRTWAAEAFNPSTYLVERLDCLPTSCSQLTLVEDLTPDWCGQCDTEGRDKPNLRRVEGENGQMRRCPRCHPYAVNTPTEQTA